MTAGDADTGTVTVKAGAIGWLWARVATRYRPTPARPSRPWFRPQAPDWPDRLDNRCDDLCAPQAYKTVSDADTAPVPSGKSTRPGVTHLTQLLRSFALLGVPRHEQTAAHTTRGEGCEEGVCPHWAPVQGTRPRTPHQRTGLTQPGPPPSVCRPPSQAALPLVHAPGLGDPPVRPSAPWGGGGHRLHHKLHPLRWVPPRCCRVLTPGRACSRGTTCPRCCVTGAAVRRHPGTSRTHTHTTQL